jgi:hypothetical protein
MKVCNFSNDIIHLNSFNYSDNYLKKNKKNQHYQKQLPGQQLGS